MSLQFIGDAGIYLPDRDAVKITAIVGDRTIDCFVGRSALDVLGCRPTDPARQIVENFEAHRLDCEIAAMVKFRRATAKLLCVEVTAADLAAIDRTRAA
jgi:hypothetical protein